MNRTETKASKPKCREVPAFTIQATQKNTKVKPPPTSDVFNMNKSSSATSSKSFQASKLSWRFRQAYDNGDLPVAIEHGRQKLKLSWKVPLDQLDYNFYLPLFFEGLTETKHPYRFVSEQGTHDLLEGGSAEKVMPCLPYLIHPLRSVMNTKNPERMCSVLKILQKLVTSTEPVGEALVPYYRQLLPVLGLFKGKNVNIGDKIEYGQRYKLNLGDLIEETLQCLESHGGPTAFINIRYVIPTFQSCSGNH